MPVNLLINQRCLIYPPNIRKMITMTELTEKKLSVKEVSYKAYQSRSGGDLEPNPRQFLVPYASETFISSFFSFFLQFHSKFIHQSPDRRNPSNRKHPKHNVTSQRKPFRFQAKWNKVAPWRSQRPFSDLSR